MADDTSPGSFWTRRRALIGGGAAVVVGAGVLAARKADHGGAHDAYFLGLSAALKAAGIAQPTMVIDERRLDHNIQTIRSAVGGAKLPLRIVVKSLPSPQLLERISNSMGTKRFMVFNGPMLSEMVRRFPNGDFLVGKPLPAVLVRQLFEAIGPQALNNVQWLVDTPTRVAEYADIARVHQTRMKLSFEIDVGLHRGGFGDPASLTAALRSAQQAGVFAIAGLMGYDAQVAKMSDIGAAYAESQQSYQNAREVLHDALPDPATQFTLNGAGSYTFMRHTHGTIANEVSVGSAFIKPSDWDIADITALNAAAFIATPVIKAGSEMRLPGHEYLDAPLRFFDPNSAQAIYIYGGHWLADPVSPPGLEYSDLIGHSSNQELLTGSARVQLKPDDYVFLRPRQSEAVLLQFGDLAVYDGEKITARWPTFPISA